MGLVGVVPNERVETEVENEAISEPFVVSAGDFVRGGNASVHIGRGVGGGRRFWFGLRGGVGDVKERLGFPPGREVLRKEVRVAHE